MASNKLRVAILGASGYTGAELVRLLSRHPQVAIVALTADRQAGKPAAEVFPQLVLQELPTLTKIDDVDWSGRRFRVLLPAARPDAGSHRQAAAASQDRRPLGRFPPARHRGVRAPGTATRITRPTCRRKRSTA